MPTTFALSSLPFLSILAKLHPEIPVVFAIGAHGLVVAMQATVVVPAVFRFEAQFEVNAVTSILVLSLYKSMALLSFPLSGYLLIEATNVGT